MNLLTMGSLEVSKSILIVESETDKFFIQEVIKNINLQEIESLETVCAIDDFECLGGISKLEQKLKEVARDIKKRDISKVGIIFDADKKGVEERKSEIDIIVNKVFSDEDDVTFHKYIINVSGYGELETVLKLIKNKDSTYANCLDAWRECLSENNKIISDKAFDKFWVQLYQRYDHCTKQEQKQAGKKCNNEVSLQKPIWDYNHTALDELKQFLKSF